MFTGNDGIQYNVSQSVGDSCLISDHSSVVVCDRLRCLSSHSVERRHSNRSKLGAAVMPGHRSYTAIAYNQAVPPQSPLSGTTRVRRYQKGKTNLDFTEARDSEWQWRQMDLPVTLELPVVGERALLLQQRQQKLLYKRETKRERDAIVGQAIPVEDPRGGGDGGDRPP